MAQAAAVLGDNEVRAWYAPVTGLARDGRIARALSWLSPDETTRYGKFRADEDRWMFLLGRVMARSLVGAALNLAPTSWEWREGPRGRPEIGSPPTALRFNVAHSAGLVVCALGRGREVGVDVEDLLRRPVERAVVEHYCGAAEVADIDARGPAWNERFLHHWTLKEAYLKARGLGISMPLAEIGFALDGAAPRVAFSGSLAGTDDRWTFVIARPTDRHLMAIAASTTDGSAPRVTIQPLPDELLA